MAQYLRGYKKCWLWIPPACSIKTKPVRKYSTNVELTNPIMNEAEAKAIDMVVFSDVKSMLQALDSEKFNKVTI